MTYGIYYCVIIFVLACQEPPSLEISSERVNLVDIYPANTLAFSLSARDPHVMEGWD